MIGYIGLPSLWVFVWYKSGRKMNVANSDTLSEEEAKNYKEMWDFHRDNSEVVKVTLESNKGKVYKEYAFVS